jgi:carbonic anhydrase
MINMAKSSSIYSKLLEGNANFRLTDKEYKELSHNQRPIHAVIACSESIVGPDKITDAKLGELFIIRALAGVLDQSGVASVEYAIEHFGVKSVIFIVHTKCVGVLAGQETLIASLAKIDEGISSPLHNTIFEIYRNIAKNSENSVDLTHAAMDNAMAETQKLVEKSDVVKRGLLSDVLTISIALYDVESGVLTIEKNMRYDKNTSRVGFIDTVKDE